MDVAAVLKEVAGWTADARAELLGRLQDEFPDDCERPPLTPELMAELDRRIADIEANPDDVYTWDEVMAYVKRPKS